MSPDHLERRLARALQETATGLPVSAGRLPAVTAHGARRRRWARAATAVSSLAAAGIVAIASAWAVGAGGPAPAGGITGDTSPEVAVSTTAVDTDVVVGTVPDSATTTAPPGDETVGTAPPTTSITGESDETVGTVPDSATTTAPPGDATVGTAPPTTSITGESDETVGTVPDSATTTAPPGDASVGTTPPTTHPSNATAPPLLACPAYGELTDDFGAVGDGNRIHKGIDVIAPKGTPVWAADAGTVTVRTFGPNGNAVHLTAADGTVFVYAHLHDIAVDDGAKVGAGDQLGTIGETGLVDRPQLHFEIRPVGGEAIGPYLAVQAACG